MFCSISYVHNKFCVLMGPWIYSSFLMKARLNMIFSNSKNLFISFKLKEKNKVEEQ